jgi:hypothetical protein
MARDEDTAQARRDTCQGKCQQAGSKQSKAFTGRTGSVVRCCACRTRRVPRPALFHVLSLLVSTVYMQSNRQYIVSKSRMIAEYDTAYLRSNEVSTIRQLLHNILEGAILHSHAPDIKRDEPERDVFPIGCVATTVILILVGGTRPNSSPSSFGDMTTTPCENGPKERICHDFS